MREVLLSCISSVFQSNISIETAFKPTSSATKKWKLTREVITWCSWGGGAAILSWQSSCKHPSCSTSLYEYEATSTYSMFPRTNIYLTIFRKCKVCSRPTTFLANILFFGALGMFSLSTKLVSHAPERSTRITSSTANRITPM